MSFISDLKAHVDRLLETPGEELHRWTRFVRFQVQLWQLCARRLRENNFAAMSAALCFRTLFALIPTIVLAVLLLKALGVLEDSKQSLRRFLATSGFAQIVVLEAEADGAAASDPRDGAEPPPNAGGAAPEGDAVAAVSGSEAPGSSGTEPAPTVGKSAGKLVNVADQIEELVGQVEGKMSLRRVGPVGVVLLIWTAVTLLTAMEHSLNRIFGARKARGLVPRLLLYWGVLTLGPLALAAAVYGGRGVVGSFEGIPGLGQLLVLAGRGVPVVVGVAVLAAVYKLLPNTEVRYRAAIGGAIVVVPLWLVAKWGFGIYVSKLVGTGNLYGALGLLPLFLIWLNLSWSIFLFGAELANAAVNVATTPTGEVSGCMVLGHAELLAAAIAVGRAYVAGAGPLPVEQLARFLRLPREAIQVLLERLRAARVVALVDSGKQAACLLSRPAERISVIDILGGGEDGAAGGGPAFAPDLAELVGATWARTQAALASCTLADVLARGPVDANGGLAPGVK